MKSQSLFRLRQWVSLTTVLLSYNLSSFAGAPLITDISMVPRLTIASDLGGTNQIQYSTDLGQSNWTVLTNLLVEESPYWFVDIAAPPAPYRFYQVVAFNQTNNAAPTNMSLIPAGSFLMGDTFNDATEAFPVHAVDVSAFYMDKFEVTKALWDEVFFWALSHGYSFDNAAAGKAPDHPARPAVWNDMLKWCNARSEKEGCTPAYYTSAAQTTVYRVGTTNVQENCVKWNTGYRLPTEAEWEKAARGGVSGHRFPWSDADTISHSRANYYATNTDAYDTSYGGYHPTFATGGEPYTSPVGYFAPNGYGLYDMAGNVEEWCWDWYGPYPSTPQTDPHGPSSGTLHVRRGGSWWSLYGSSGFAHSSADACRVAARGINSEHLNRGFRCVLPVSEP